MACKNQPKRRKLLSVVHTELPLDCWGIVFTYLLDFEKAILSACSRRLRWLLHSHPRFYGPILYHPRSVFGPKWVSTPIDPEEHRLSQTTNGVVMSARELPPGPSSTEKSPEYHMRIMSFSQWYRDMFVVVDATEVNRNRGSLRLYFKQHKLGGIKILYIVRKPCRFPGRFPGRYSHLLNPAAGHRYEIYAHMCRGCGDLYNFTHMYKVIIDMWGECGGVAFRPIAQGGPWRPVIRNENITFIKCHNCKSRFCERCSFHFPRAYADGSRMNEEYRMCPFCYVDYESVEIGQPVTSTDSPSTNIADLQREIFELQKLVYEKESQVQDAPTQSV